MLFSLNASRVKQSIRYVHVLTFVNSLHTVLLSTFTLLLLLINDHSNVKVADINRTVKFRVPLATVYM